MKEFVLVLLFWDSSFANGPVSVERFASEKACKAAGDLMASEIVARFEKRGNPVEVEGFCFPLQKY